MSGGKPGGGTAPGSGLKPQGTTGALMRDMKRIRAAMSSGQVICPKCHQIVSLSVRACPFCGREEQGPIADRAVHHV
jgi:hypothetical protein